MTQTSGGNRIMMAYVSQVDECFMKITWLPAAGRFSRPSTTYVRPQSHFSPKKHTWVITPAIQKRPRKFRKGVIRQYITPKLMVHTAMNSVKTMQRIHCM